MHPLFRECTIDFCETEDLNVALPIPFNPKNIPKAAIYSSSSKSICNPNNTLASMKLLPKSNLRKL